MADAIREMFVQIGWQVNTAQQKQAYDAIVKMASIMQAGSKKVVETHKETTKGTEQELRKQVDLHTKAAQAVGTSIGESIGRIAGYLTAFGAAYASGQYFTNVVKDLDELSKFSQKTGASITGIRALGLAFESAGGHAEDASTALNALALAARNPVGAAWLKTLGATSADTATQVVQLQKAFAGKSTFIQDYLGRQIGIGPDIVKLIAGGRLQHYMEESKAFIKAFNVDQERAARGGRSLAEEWGLFGTAMTQLRDAFMGGALGSGSGFLGGINEFLKQNGEGLGRMFSELGNEVGKFIHGNGEEFVKWLRNTVKEANEGKLGETFAGWKKPLEDVRTILSAIATLIKFIHTITTKDILYGDKDEPGPLSMLGVGKGNPNVTSKVGPGTEGGPVGTWRDIWSSIMGADEKRTQTDIEKNTEETAQNTKTIGDRFQEFFTALGIGGPGGAAAQTPGATPGTGGATPGGGGGGATPATPPTETPSRGGVGGFLHDLSKPGSWWRRKMPESLGGDPVTGSGVAAPEGPGKYRPAYKLTDADKSQRLYNIIAGEAIMSNPRSVDAVINNMFNRLGSRWGNSRNSNLLEVATAQGQYEAAWKGGRKASPKESEYLARRISEIASGGVPDITGGANTYRASGYGTKGGSRWFTQFGRFGAVVGGNRYAYDPSMPNGPYSSYRTPKGDVAVPRPPSMTPEGGAQPYGPIIVKPSPAPEASAVSKLGTKIGEAALELFGSRPANAAESLERIRAIQPLAPSNTANDNSRKIDYDATYNTTINGVGGDPRSAATAFQRAHQDTFGLDIRALKGVVR